MSTGTDINIERSMLHYTSIHVDSKKKKLFVSSYQLSEWKTELTKLCSNFD